KASQIAEANSQLAAKEALYTSRNYTTAFSGNVGFGCDPYVGEAGCAAGNTVLQIGIGYNEVSVYENIQTFSQHGAWSSAQDPGIDASKPILGAEGAIVCAGGPISCQGNGENPYVSFHIPPVRGADNIYLMVHNKDGVARNLLIEFFCPDAVAK
ncbi:MAG: hypothetical protein V1845_04200, partial [bacterium]